MIKNILRGVIAQLGAFVFIETLLFKPMVFTIDDTDMSLQLSAPLIIAVIVLMIVCAFVLESLKRHALHQTMRLVAWSAVLLPGITLLMFVVFACSSMTFPLVSTLLLGFAALSQIYCFSFRMDLDTYELVCSSGIGVLLSALLIFSISEIVSIPLMGIMLMTGIVLVSGIFLKHVDGKQSLDDDRPPVSVSSLIHLPENLDTATMSLRDKVLVSSPVALMVVMCSASSGLAAGSPEGILLDTNFWSLISVLPIGLLFLWSLVWFWKRFMDIDTLLISSAVPLAIALLLFIVSYQFQSGYRVSLGFLIQLMFLMLGWACALLLGRINSRTEIIAPYYVIMLIALFGLFILISQLLDPSVFSEVFAFLALAFLVYLLVLFFIKSRPPSNRLSDEPEMSMQQDELDLVLLRKCRLITDCYGLSARESEVLPLIIMGDSSTVIAKRLFISPATVKTYRYRIFCKMNVHNHEELLVCVRAIEDTRAEPR